MVHSLGLWLLIFLWVFTKSNFCKVLLYQRYVDDIICLLNCEIDAMKFFDYLNFRHLNIKFHLKSNGGKLAFLDILIPNENDNICASVFRKKTSVGLYTNFASFTPFSYKIGLIKTLLHRAFQISSSMLPMILAIKKKCFWCCDIWTKRMRYPKVLCCSYIARHVDRLKHW